MGERWVVTKDMPFGRRESDLLVLIKPTLDELLKAVVKVASGPTKTEEQQRRVEAAQELLDSDDVTVGACKQFLGSQTPPATEKLMSTILLKMKQRGLMKSRWHSVTCVPFVDIDKDPSPPDQLNIFEPFALLGIAPAEIALEETAIWHWLTRALAREDPHKIEWLCCYFGKKLQHPDRKIMKFLVLFSTITGSGKTSMRYFCEALFDASKCLFCDTVSEFLGDENSELLNRLWVFLDDIEKCKKSSADKLKSKITSTTFRLKRLYENRITMPSYVDLIATSNEANPVFLDCDDRRSELISVDPLFAGNTNFWDQFYEELANPGIMSAFFTFFAQYKLSMDVTAKTCRFDKVAIQKAKISSMKQSHAFLTKFFEDSNCFDYCTPKGDWWREMMLRKTLGKPELVIGNKRLYGLFTEWSKQENYRNRVKRATFFEHLRELGVPQLDSEKAGRFRMGGSKLRGVVFEPERVFEAVNAFYKTETKWTTFLQDAESFKKMKQDMEAAGGSHFRN